MKIITKLDNTETLTWKLRWIESNLYNVIRLLTFLTKDIVCYKDVVDLIKQQTNRMGINRINKERFVEELIYKMNDGSPYGEIDNLIVFPLYTIKRNRWSDTTISLFLLQTENEIVYCIDRSVESLTINSLRHCVNITPHSLTKNEDCFWNSYDNEYWTMEGLDNGEMRYIEHEDVYAPIDETVYCVDSCEYGIEENCYYHSETDEWYQDEDNIPEDNCEDEYIKEYNSGIPPYFIVGNEIVNQETSLQVLSLVMEIEVEFQCSEDRLEFAKALSDKQSSIKYKALSKRDGSLSDYTGLEVATSPYCIESAKDSFCAIASLLREYGASGNHSGYGIHLHYNKFVQLSEFYAIALLHDYRNFENILKFSNRLSRTNGCLSFNRYDSLNELDVATSDRYSVLNKRLHSYENRMFQSTLRHSTILKNVEYMEAIYQFSKVLLDNKLLEDIHFSEYDRFIDYCMENGNRYPNLKETIIKKNISKQYAEQV